MPACLPAYFIADVRCLEAAKAALAANKDAATAAAVAAADAAVQSGKSFFVLQLHVSAR